MQPLLYSGRLIQSSPCCVGCSTVTSYLCTRHICGNDARRIDAENASNLDEKSRSDTVISRTTFFREKKKVGAYANVKKKWLWYDALSFLDGHPVHAADPLRHQVGVLRHGSVTTLGMQRTGLHHCLRVAAVQRGDELT